MNKDEVIKELKKVISECNLLLKDLLKEKNKRTEELNKTLNQEITNSLETHQITELERQKLIISNYHKYKSLVMNEESDKIKKEILNKQFSDKERIISILIFMIIFIIYNILKFLFPCFSIFKSIVQILLIISGSITFLELTNGPIIAIMKRVNNKLNETKNIKSQETEENIQQKISALQLQVQNKRKNFINNDKELLDLNKKMAKLKEWLNLFVNYLDKLRENNNVEMVKEENFAKFNEEKQQLTLKKCCVLEMR